MRSYFLHARFEEEDEHGFVATFDEVISKPSDRLDQLVVVDAHSISLFMSQQKPGNDKPLMVAIFVPLSFLNFLKKENELTSESSFSCPPIRILEEADVQKRALALISAMLQHEPCRILMLLRSKSKEFSDILLLDVSLCDDRWFDEMSRRLCGEPMQICDSAVIELFPISSVTPRQSQQSVATGSSIGEPHYEIPACPACLFRIYPPRLGMPKPRNDQLCSEYCVPGRCRNEIFLQPWSSSSCKACSMIQSEELENVYCNCCALQETLWICLTCGFVGCGRYSHGHAAKHFADSQHPFSLEMATLRIWDYVSGEFAHRGDFLECASTNRHHNHHHNLSQWNVALPWEVEKKGTSASSSWDETSPKKTSMVIEEYEALLQSALVDQAQYYEGEISRRHAQLACEQYDENSMTLDEKAEVEELKGDIQRLREDLHKMGRSFLEMQAHETGHRAASQRLLREQAIAKTLLDKIREETEKENQEGKLIVEDLEQQIADLTANLRMRHQISKDGELSQAQIYGTATPSSKMLGAKRSGTKKSRRGNRK